MTKKMTKKEKILEGWKDFQIKDNPELDMSKYSEGTQRLYKALKDLKECSSKWLALFLNHYKDMCYLPEEIKPICERVLKAHEFWSDGE